MVLSRSLRVTALALIALGACAAPPPKSAVAAWIDASAVPARMGSRRFAPFDAIFERVHVVGLGEATHGQRESFELKRELVLRLVREHGCRLVAYECSASRALATDAYVQGASDDLDAAVDGLGMLIWRVEENAELLRELRAWNAAAAEGERVRFVGIDLQDPEAAAERLAALVADPPEIAARARRIARELEPAVSRLWSGELDDYERLAAAAAELRDEVAALGERRPELGAEAALRAKELWLGVEMHRSPGGRDLALFEMFREALDAVGPGARAAIWSHNAHVMRGPLRYLASDEPALGGRLGAELGDDYYALGFLFGEGAFHANDRDASGAWGFRRYELGPPPRGSLEAPFVQSGRGDCLVDLRDAPPTGAVAAWLDSGHGQRWFGGYGIATDYADAARDAARLEPTFPRADFDGLVYLARTTPATPREPARILSAE